MLRVLFSCFRADLLNASLVSSYIIKLCLKLLKLLTFNSSISFTGQHGGARVAVQLRTFTGGIGLITVPCQCLIPAAHETIAEDGKTENEQVKRQLNTTLDHLYWATNAFKAYSVKIPPPQWAPS